LFTPYAVVTVDCEFSQARTSPTRKAVIFAPSLIGWGKVPAFTLRHSVAPLKGSGAGRSGRLGLCTKHDSRMNALSGRVSNDGIPAVAVGIGAEMAPGIVDCFALGLRDIVCPHVIEGSTVELEARLE
jgi:hypothetical protein